MTRSHGRRNDGQDSRGSCSGCLRLRRLLFLLHDELEQLLQKKSQKMSKNANYVAIADASGFSSTMSWSNFCKTILISLHIKVTWPSILYISFFSG